MTREEAIELKAAVGRLMYSDNKDIRDYNALIDFIDTAIRPVSREQVEKAWRGEWKCHGDCGVTECSACGWNIEEYVGNYNFCPVCGAPMTDEAVDMVMERINEMEGTGNGLG